MIAPLSNGHVALLVSMSKSLCYRGTRFSAMIEAKGSFTCEAVFARIGRKPRLHLRRIELATGLLAEPNLLNRRRAAP
jgi:hypothetical protein